MPDIAPGDLIEALLFTPTVEASSGSSITGITNTSWTAGSPVVDTTFLVPPTGRVEVTVGGGIVSESTHRIFLSYEIYEGTSSSGTLVHAANRIYGIGIGDTDTFAYASRTRTIFALTPRTTHYIRLMHEVNNSAASASIVYRDVSVKPAT